MAIRDIWGPFLTQKWFLQNKGIFNKTETYDFKSLKNSIKENGVLNPLHVEILWWESSIDKQYKYRVLDGNHRAYCLLDMYGEDYEVECEVAWNSRIESS